MTIDDVSDSQSAPMNSSLLSNQDKAKNCTGNFKVYAQQFFKYYLSITY